MSGVISSPKAIAEGIADAVAGLPATQARCLIAIAGPPGSGKSTVSGLARDELEARGTPTGLLWMDGFHYDNAILSQRDLLNRKGAPETFDVAGFRAILTRLLTEDEVAIPEFDRPLDKAFAARSIISAEQRIVLVEGNYLLLNEPEWIDLQKLWTLAIFLDVPHETLEARLVDRWVSLGLSHKAANDRAQSNDIPNANRIVENSSRGDLVFT